MTTAEPSKSTHRVREHTNRCFSANKSTIIAFIVSGVHTALRISVPPGPTWDPGYGSERHRIRKTIVVAKRKNRQDEELRPVAIILYKKHIRKGVFKM
jgi:hypothetical protein